MPQRDEVYQITGARQAASVGRDFRTRRYLISMAIRTACFLGAVFVDGWMRWVMIAGAILLPYIAVVMANDATEEDTTDLPPPLIIKDDAALPPGRPDPFTG